MRTDVILFNATEVATLGNKFLGAIVAHELAKEAAENELQQAGKRENFIDVELIKAMMFLHSEEKIDLYKVYGDNKETASLYRGVLLSLGVLNRIVSDDDKVEYEYTDPALQAQFHFPASMNDPRKEGESDESYVARTSEYLRRRSRRNSLNLRLARCAKAAIALTEANATIDDIQYRDNAAGQTEAVLTKGPASVIGKGKEVVIVSGNAKAVEGAAYSPTITGLVKVADAGHKVAPSKPASGEGATRQPTDGDKSGDEQDFLAMCNAFLMTIKGREGVFADAERTVLNNVLAEIKGVLAKK